MNPKANANPCPHQTLAHSDLGRITVCPDCGVVHLHMDCASLRLEVDRFEALAHMVLMARWRLHSKVARAAAQLTAEALKAAAAPRR